MFREYFGMFHGVSAKEGKMARQKGESFFTSAVAADHECWTDIESGP